MLDTILHTELCWRTSAPSRHSSLHVVDVVSGLLAAFVGRPRYQLAPAACIYHRAHRHRSLRIGDLRTRLTLGCRNHCSCCAPGVAQRPGGAWTPGPATQMDRALAPLTKLFPRSWDGTGGASTTRRRRDEILRPARPQYFKRAIKPGGRGQIKEKAGCAQGHTTRGRLGG